jgi:hypothetical protein
LTTEEHDTEDVSERLDMHSRTLTHCRRLLRIGLLMLLACESFIHVIALPKTTAAQCLLTKAQSPDPCGSSN